MSSAKAKNLKGCQTKTRWTVTKNRERMKVFRNPTLKRRIFQRTRNWNEIISEEMLGRRERRRRKVVDIGRLEDCLCGSRAEPTANNVIRCKGVRCETVWVSELTFCQDFNVKLTYIFLLKHFSITSFAFNLSRCPRIGSAMHVQRREVNEEGRLRGGDIKVDTCLITLGGSPKKSTLA